MGKIKTNVIWGRIILLLIIEFATLASLMNN